MAGSHKKRGYVMYEKAFMVKRDSEFYKKYFLMQEEKEKFKLLASKFFDKHELNNVKKYAISQCLCVELDKNDAKFLSNQLKKERLRNGLYQFKLRSQMQIAWVQEVVSNCNIRSIDSFDAWYFEYINRGRYSLWHNGNDLYGYLSDTAKDIVLPDFFIPIKMSEYYSAIEKFEEQLGK